MTEPVIRPLATLEERKAAVELQEATWGGGFADRVPASILMVAQEVGGVASGAFEGDRLVGLVFGITGLRGGRPVHWSDMLAVAPSHRGRGLGYRLKLHQRELLLPRGVETVLWTFDPLEARNAHLNLNRLGAVAREYRRDLYGDSDSPLHAGIGTDRLLAEWPIASERVRRRLAGDPTDPEPDDERLTIEVPADIQALKTRDPERARAWRARSREAFERAFAQGFVAVGLARDEGVSRYLLTRAFTL